MDIEIDPAFFNKMQDSQKKWQDFEFMQVLGREKRAHLGRQIVYAIWPTVFDEIPYEEDEIFLHPSIFSMALSRSRASIIPKLLAEVWASGKVENITRKKLNVVNGLTILNHEFHNFEHIIVGSNSPPPELIDEIVRAIGVLKKTSPELCELLFRSTYYLLPFCDSEQNSFADERFPGVIFINVSREVSSASLIEDIVHQSMHCVFSDVEASGALIYTVPAEGLISDYLSGPSAHRTISVLHHSALTEAASVTALANLLSDYSLDKHQQLEALARIVFLNLKIQIDLGYIEKISALDEYSMHVFTLIISEGLKKMEETKKLDADFKYFSQGYNFSFSAFLHENAAVIKARDDFYAQ